MANRCTYLTEMGMMLLAALFHEVADGGNYEMSFYVGRWRWTGFDIGDP